MCHVCYIFHLYTRADPDPLCGFILCPLCSVGQACLLENDSNTVFTWLSNTGVVAGWVIGFVVSSRLLVWERVFCQNGRKSGCVFGCWFVVPGLVCHGFCVVSVIVNLAAVGAGCYVS